MLRLLSTPKLALFSQIPTFVNNLPLNPYLQSTLQSLNIDILKPFQYQVPSYHSSSKDVLEY